MLNSGRGNVAKLKDDLRLTKTFMAGSILHRETWIRSRFYLLIGLCTVAVIFRSANRSYMR